MIRVGIILIALLATASQSAEAQVLFGGGVEGGAAQTKVSKAKEVDKSGATFGVHGGLSIFPTATTVLTAAVGIQTFSVDGEANKRSQRVSARLGLAQLDYALRLEDFEPGLLARLNYGEVATLLASDRGASQLTASFGPKLAYRWYTNDADVLTYVAATFDVLGRDQTKRALLFGVSYWLGRSEPAGDGTPLNATTEPPPPAAPPEAPAAVSIEPVTAPVDLRIKADVFLFATNSDELTPESAVKAKELVKALAGLTPAWTAIEVVGHSDANSKVPARNLVVSERRAATIRDLLVASGVSPSSIRARGVGASEPLPGLDATSPLNRRVEITIVGTTDPSGIADALKAFIP